MQENKIFHTTSFIHQGGYIIKFESGKKFMIKPSSTLTCSMVTLTFPKPFVIQFVYISPFNEIIGHGISTVPFNYNQVIEPVFLDINDTEVYPAEIPEII